MTTVSDLIADTLLVDLGGPISFWFNKLLGRYINASTGRMVAEKTVLRVGEAFTEKHVAPRIKDLTERMIKGKIDLASWQERMAKELKNSYIVNLTLGKGGRNNLTPADWGRIGGRLKYEYRHLEGFAQDIKAGKLSEGQIIFRANMYADGARSAYYDGRTAAMGEAAYDLERRFLGAAEHCEDCLAYAAQGWVPIGSLPEPGDGSVCRNNCKCTKEYARSAEMSEG